MARPIVMRHLIILTMLLACMIADPARGAPAELVFNPARCATSGSEILVEGIVTSDELVTLVLRVDDDRSANYATRVNLERLVPAGPFKWQVPLDGMRTSGGEALHTCAITFITVFIGAGVGEMQLKAFSIAKGPDAGGNILAYDLGPEGSPLFPGFEPMSPGHPALAGSTLNAIRRPGPDALIGDGIAGINEIRIPVPQGIWKVTLWTEDPGEWETLPHPFSRSIMLNGTAILDEKQSAGGWLNSRYLAGKYRTYRDGQTAWQAIGRHRGGMVSAVHTIGAGGLTISLFGDSPAAGFVSAIVVEPAESEFAASVQKRREEDFNEVWRILPTSAHEVTALEPPAGLMLTPGSGASFSVSMNTSNMPKHAQVSVNSSNGLVVHLWKNQPRLVRAKSGGAALEVSDRFLTAVPADAVSLDERPLLLTGWAAARADAAPGVHKMAVTVSAGDFARTAEIPVTVLDAILPQVRKQSGFYLDEAPHLAWGDNPQEARARQVDCDLGFLSSLGILGNAPALATPAGTPDDTFTEDVSRFKAAGTALPALAYAPAKRLYSTQPLDSFVGAILAADKRARSVSGPGLIWSMADEPSNAGASAAGLLETASILKSASPAIRLAGHFNHKGDERYASYLDTILVNPGFGVDAADIEKLEPDREVWLYNLDKPRLAAGLFLHHSKAQRYVQWHARMPTADPFDPTDGREDDFQIFLPVAQTCPALPDIHQDMLEMADGLVDQQWLLWLDGADEPEARKLAARWKALAQSNWRELSAHTELSRQFREEATMLARILKRNP